MADTYVLGIDVGTQSVRAALVDLQGRTHHYATIAIDNSNSISTKHD